MMVLNRLTVALAAAIVVAAVLLPSSFFPNVHGLFT